MITINLVVILLIIIVAMIAIIIIIVDVTIMINITIRRELKYKKTTLEKTRLLYIRQIPVLRTADRPYITPTQPSTRQYSSCPLISPMTRRQRASMRTIHCRRRIMKALCVWMDPLLVTIWGKERVKVPGNGSSICRAGLGARPRSRVWVEVKQTWAPRSS